jgi:hypothetical protein
VELAGDVPVVEALQLAQHERSALPFRQGTHRTTQRATEHVAVEFTGRVVRDGTVRGGVPSSLFVAPPPMQRPADVQASMHDSPQEPGPRLGWTRGRPPQREQTLLHRIPREIVTAEEPTRPAHQAGNLVVDQVRERALDVRIRRYTRGAGMVRLTSRRSPTVVHGGMVGSSSASVMPRKTTGVNAHGSIPARLGCRRMHAFDLA